MTLIARRRPTARYAATAVRILVLSSILISSIFLSSSAILAQQPTFRSTVEVTAIDVIVVDGKGQPITDLAATDFRVKVDGRDRRVVSARYVPQTRTADAAHPPELIEGYSSNQGSIEGRLFVIAVDQPNLRHGSIAGMRPALNSFLDRLEPEDRVSAVSLGHGLSTPLTTDRASIKSALSNMAGDMKSVAELGTYNVAISEALEIAHGNANTFDHVSMRECMDAPPRPIPAFSCWYFLYQDAVRISDEVSDASARTFQALRGLLRSLKNISGPKTLVIVTEGFLLADQGPEGAVALGSMAAAAQTTVYILKMDDYTIDSTTSAHPTATLDDRRIRRDGVELLAGVARGSVFDVQGSGESAVRQIEKETAGYYLIGLESVPSDRDRKPHPLAVRVTRPRANVRARVELSDSAVPVRTPAESVANALRSPFDTSGLPVRLTAFPFRQGDGPDIQVLIHAEAGTDYTALTPVTIGYVISNSRGEVIADAVGAATLAPAVPGTPSPLIYANGITLPPGDYSLKFAFTEGGRVGSVEHFVHAALEDAGPARVSDLVVGGPPTDREPPRPAIGYDISFGRVQGYFEVYGRGVNDWRTTYEVSKEMNGPPLLSTAVAGRVTGDARMVFSKILPVATLAPGRYFLRASLSANDRTLKTISREFRLNPAAPSIASTAAATFSAAPATVALPVPDHLLTPRFDRPLALGETLQRFRATVVPAARPQFDAGAAAFAVGDYAAAEAAFRESIQPATVGGANGSNMAALAYLGAVAAAAANDEEAVRIWRIAVEAGTGLPEVFQWMGQAWIRLGLIPQSRAAFGEGALRWPSDPQFGRSLATVYARLGQSREALETIAASLTQRPADVEMLALGVEWVYRAHEKEGRASDAELTLVRRWADAYENGKGPRGPELRAWIRQLEAGTSRVNARNPL